MELLLFLLAVGIVSLSGVLMPGPVFAAAIVKGAENRHAGAWIALGHLLVEVPLILLIAGGLHYVFANDSVKTGIGFAGGALLLYMGIRMFQMRKKEEVIKHAFPMHPMIAGVVTTATNPYFILWWATVGASFILLALGFGVVGLLAFMVVHESCDLGWDYFVAYTVFRSRKLWTRRIHASIFGGCGVLLIAFGIYFLFAFWMK